MGLLDSLLNRKPAAAPIVPSDDPRPTRGWGPSDEKAFEVRFDNVFMAALYDYAFYSDCYRTIINAKTRETFRNGGEWKPRFTRKCTSEVCGIEFDNDIEDCSVCGAETREPDKLQLKTPEIFEEKANDNEQTLLEVFASINPDFEILDNSYLVLIKQYAYDEKGEIISGNIKEILRGDPLYMRMIIDRAGRPGIDYFSNQSVMICPEHRTKPNPNTVLKCPTCGRKTYVAHFKSFNNDKEQYYLAGEVQHFTMYTPTIYYGFPMALTVLSKIRTLLAMDNYIYQYYGGQKSPKGMAVVRTSNQDSAQKAWDKYIENVKRDPHMIYPFFVPSSGVDQNKLIEYVDFSRSLEEMQYMEARTEMINRIGAPFGVSPVYQADLSTGGGLNNEGLQITVTTRAVETSQAIYNKMSRWIFQQFGVTDWDFVMKAPEEKDEMAELQREAQKITNAQAMQSLGFEVERTKDGEFKYEEKPKPAGAQPARPIEQQDPTQGLPQPDQERRDGAPA